LPIWFKNHHFGLANQASGQWSSTEPSELVGSPWPGADCVPRSTMESGMNAIVANHTYKVFGKNPEQGVERLREGMEPVLSKPKLPGPST
jgi:hypothetical protein